MIDFKVGDVIIDRDGFVDRIVSVDPNHPMGLVELTCIKTPTGVPLLPHTSILSYSSFNSLNFKLHPDYEKSVKLNTEVATWLNSK